MSFERLVRKYKGVKNIPNDVLQQQGYLRFRGRIVAIDELDSAQVAEALDIKDLELHVPQTVKERKKEEVKGVLDSLFKGSLSILSDDFKEELLKDTHGYIDEYFETRDIDVVEGPIHFKIPALEFAKAAEHYVKNRKYSANLLAEFLESCYEEGEFEGLNAKTIFQGFIEQEKNWNKKILLRSLTAAINLMQDYPQEIKEFEAKYGSISALDFIPFVCYVLLKRGMFIRTSNEEEFLGKSHFALYKEFVERFGHIEGAERLAHEIFFGTPELALENCRGIRREYIMDKIPLPTLDILFDPVDEFLSIRKRQGNVIAYIDTSSYCVDIDCLTGNPELRRTLRDVYNAETGADQKINERYAFLNGIVSSESKRKKIMRLCEHSDDFRELVDAYIKGDADYADSIKENKKVTRELQRLGVDTNMFYHGIPSREFVLRGGQALTREEVKKEYLLQYRNVLENIFSGSVINAPERLKQKLIDKLREEGQEYDEKTPLLDFLISASENDGVSRKICNVVAEYASQKPNIKNAQASAAAVYHLRNFSKFLRGAYIIEEGQKSSVYKLKLATKNPLTDVDIGNDGGCCIGIYDDEENNGAGITPESFKESLRTGGLGSIDGNGQYMPFYLKDRATQFVEIWQGDERVGMALIFASKNELNEPVLVVNSIEMSEKLEQSSNRNAVIENAIDYIRNYGHASGFKHRLMSGHGYNPAAYFRGKQVEFKKVEKIHPWAEQFYSDIFGEDKTCRADRLSSC